MEYVRRLYLIPADLRALEQGTEMYIAIDSVVDEQPAFVQANQAGGMESDIAEEKLAGSRS